MFFNVSFLVSIHHPSSIETFVKTLNFVKRVSVLFLIVESPLHFHLRQSLLLVGKKRKVEKALKVWRLEIVHVYTLLQTLLPSLTHIRAVGREEHDSRLSAPPAVKVDLIPIFFSSKDVFLPPAFTPSHHTSMLLRGLKSQSCVGGRGGGQSLHPCRLQQTSQRR